jgi:dUTP pyrophosphatase
MKQIQVKVICKYGVQLPEYATPMSSGVDVRCLEDVELLVGERTLVHTGLYFQLPEGIEVQVRSRSGLALKKGVIVLNAPGTIDADYRGECNVILMNLGEEDVEFKAGERIAQFVFCDNVVHANFEKVDNFDNETERGAGGFGHTGTK